MKFLKRVLFSLLVLLLPLTSVSSQTKNDSSTIKILQERIDQLNREKQELNLRHIEENFDTKLQAQKEEFIIRIDNIDSKINTYLGIGGFLILIISIVGLRTIGKWIKQTIENQTKNKIEDLEKVFNERAEALIEKKLAKLTKDVSEIEEFTSDLKALSNQLKNKNMIIDETLTEESAKILKVKLESINQDFHFSYEDWLYKGMAEHGLSKYREAIKSFNKAIEKNQDMPEAYSRKGLAYYKLEEYENALECFEKALGIDSNYAFAHNAKGLVYFQLRKYDEAIKCHNKAIELDPSDKWPFENRGYAFLHQKKYEEAIKDFNEALKRDEKFLNAYRDRALAYEMLNKYDKAENDIEAAIEINPKSIKSHEILSKIQIIKGDYENALNTIKRAYSLLLPNSEEPLILCYLDLVIKRILDIELKDKEKQFERIVEHMDSLPRYFEVAILSIGYWLKESNLNKEKKGFIREKTEMLKKLKVR